MPMGRLQISRRRLRGMGDANATVIPGQSVLYYGTGDALYNAFIGGPLNSLGLVSTPLTDYQLQQIAADTGYGTSAPPETPAQKASRLALITQGAQITPDVIDLSSITGIVSSAGSVNWVLILVLLAGGGFVAYKIFS